MIIRYAEYKDIASMKALYLEEDITFPDKFIISFVIEDEGNILAAGGVNVLPEISVAIRKDLPVVRKGRILRMILDLIHYRKYLGPFYVFVNDEKWEEQLKGYGFEEAKGKVLIYHGE